MIAVLFEKECRALLRDGRLIAFAVAVVLLCVAVLWVSHGESERRRLEKREIEQATREQWDRQGDKHPHRGAHFGLYVFAPESALTAFDPGVQPHLGEAIWLEPHRRNLSRLSTIPEDVMHGRLGEFTPAFVLIGILPLLIVAAAYGSIAGEREAGTLRLVRGLGTHLASFVWSKVLALTIAIASVVGLVFGIIGVLAADAGRTIMLGASFLLYCSIFIAIGFTVSAISRTSRNALLVLTALWLLFVWAVPRAGAAFAAARVDLPTAESFWAQIRHDYQQGLPGDGDLATRNRRFDDRLLREHGVAKLEDLPLGAYAVRRLNRDAYADQVHRLHFEQLWLRFDEQEALLRRAAILSPVIAMRLVSMKLSGTDLQHRKAFEDAAEQYRRYFNTHIDRWDERNSIGLRSFDDRYGNDALWQSVRRFHHRPQEAVEAARNALPELGILGCWAAATFLVLAAVARKVRV